MHTSSCRTLKPDAPRLFPHSNGSIIAVSYEARPFGVKRNMRAQEAKGLCPGLQIVQVPVAHGKADLTIYRAAGAAVAQILARMKTTCERASIDEVCLRALRGFNP
jgi:DNA polymerase eta